MKRVRVEGSVARPLWILIAGAFAGGWALAFTYPGAALIYAATLAAVLLVLLQRSPAGLQAFTIVTSLGWYITFLTWPWLLVVPATLLLVAAWWKRRRRPVTGP